MGQAAGRCQDRTLWVFHRSQDVGALRAGRKAHNAGRLGRRRIRALKRREYSGIDLDGCRDAETGKLQAWAQAAIDLGETYAEVSPSGRGLRFFVQGKVEGRKVDAAQVEIYTAGRYLTVTGQHVSGTPTEIRPAPRLVAYLQERADQIREAQRAAADLARETERKKADKHTAEPQRPTTSARASAAAADRHKASARADRGDFFRHVKDRALANLSAWVPIVFPTARWQAGTSAYRVSQRDLGEGYEEDLSLHPSGIRNYGVHDMGDAHDGGRSAIDIVQDYLPAKDAVDAALWLCDRLGIRPEDIGWRARRSSTREGKAGRDTSGEARKEGSQGGSQTDDGSAQAMIQIVNGEVPRAVTETEEAIIVSGTPIFTRSGSLVRPVIETVPAAKGRQTTVARLKTMCAASLADHAAQVVCYQRFDGRSKDWTTINPPAEVMNALLARDGKWRLHPVAGIITTPTLRADGSILDRPGYDPETRLFLSLDPGFRMPAISAHPGREEAVKSLRLLEELLSDFPFVSEVDRSVGLSCLMTPVVRGALPTAPLHAIRASTPGTGKSYLVDLASVIATGRRCPVIAAGRTEEETEKRLGALLREGVPIISIDNVNGELGGDALCQMTSQPIVRVRVLGKSEAPETECRATTFATGNGLILVGDMTRRTVLCTLDTEAERPELRDFSFDPIEKVHADRGAYVAAVLTIIRAYRVAGSPKVCGPVGSYEDWTQAVRAPLIWLGHDDPCVSMEKAREEDPELSAIRELFGHWSDHLSLSSGYTANAIIKVACAKALGASFDYGTIDFTAPEFRDLLLRQAGDGGAVNSKRLGKCVNRHGIGTHDRRAIGTHLLARCVPPTPTLKLTPRSWLG